MRCAITYVPPPEDPLTLKAAAWLGRDSYSGMPTRIEVEGLTPGDHSFLTALPRRSGFHATLKPPFTLEDGHSVHELERRLTHYSNNLAPIDLEFRIALIDTPGSVAEECRPMSYPSLSATEAEALRVRYAAVLDKPLYRRLLVPLLVLGALGYLVFCVFFFDVPRVIAEAQWERAPIYIADWYSWEATPRFRFKDDAVAIEWTRSLLGADPHPDWIEQTGPHNYVVRFNGTVNQVEISPFNVVAVVDGKRYRVAISEAGAALPADAPANMSIKGDRVTVDYGFVGLAEIRNTQVYVRHRFLGWPNFFFDAGSPFFGMDMPTVWQTITTGAQIDPNRPNWRLMVDEFLFNSEWQHLDVWTKLLQTIVMAFVGTLFAAVLAFPLAFLAARSITRNRVGNWLMKRFFDVLRSIDMLIWALFFVRGFGPGPIPGIAAIFFTDTGTLGKTSTEALENLDDRQREGIKSVGAAPLEVQRYGVVPQVLPVFLSQALYFWESNTRSATIIGAVGAGGIGLKLIEAMRTNQDWENVFYMVLLILLVVFIFDNISNALRSRLIGPGL